MGFAAVLTSISFHPGTKSKSHGLRLCSTYCQKICTLDVQARNLRKPQCLWIMWGPPPRLICTIVGLSRHPNIYVGPFLTIFAIMMMSLWNIPLHRIHIMRTIEMLVLRGLVTWVHPRGLGVYKLPTDCHYILHLPKYFGEQQKWIIYYQPPNIISVLHTSDSISNGKKRLL